MKAYSKALCLVALVWVWDVSATVSRSHNGYLRYQRGDQGPDDDYKLNGGRVETSTSVVSMVPPVGGPNVCRSRERKFCCPGWSQRGITGLCLVPICTRGCGQAGKCIKPNLCLCEGGKIGSKCGHEVEDGPEPGEEPKPGANGCRSTCLNGGTCKDGNCLCRPGYAGDFCQEPVCRKDCENGGRCIGPNRCACVYGYTGRYCEIDYRTGPCYRRFDNSQCSGQLEGVVCTKQLCCATIGTAWGHPCETCPADLACQPGYLKNVHTGKCMDINECEAIPGLCKGGGCVNTVGSFTCSCPEGLAMNENHECSDYDECLSTDSKEICPNGKCINRDPGYYCLCNPGYIPTQDQKACLDARQGFCYTSFSPASRNGNGKKCRNKLAFKLSQLDCCCGGVLGVGWGEGSRNECTPCPERGSAEYEKFCQAAAHIIDSTNKDACALRSDLCENGKCISAADGSYTCQCNDGYVEAPGSQSCVDVDECRQGMCQGGRCINTPGSFDCQCPSGFHLSTDSKRCIDYNECQQIGMCANGRCINMDGSFKCECNDGFILSSSGLSCTDVDECMENPLICLHGRCKNTKGGYVCECKPGFTHSSDGAFCMDENECAVQDSNICQHGRCVNTEGGFKCVCDPGYELAANGRTCQDIDECRSSPCHSGVCINREGSFTCECPIGFSLGPDGRTCTDTVQGFCYALSRDGQCVNPSTRMLSRSSCCCGSIAFTQPTGWGTPCQPCPAPGTTEFTKLCPHGAGFTNGGDDINECALDPNICENGACENMLGGYRCICDPGYAVNPDGLKCLDVDECKDPFVCNGGQCRNIPGSFQCVCPSGTQFNPTTKQCEDENECEGTKDVCPNGKCFNTDGGYECECDNGMALDSSASMCIDNRRGSCWTNINPTNNQCENNLNGLMLKSECCCSIGMAWGSPCERCNPALDCKDCPVGMAKLDGKTCQDINECAIDSSLCSGGICINTEGSFTCRCPNGLSLNSAGTSCIDERREPCYLDYRLGICTDDIGGLYKRDKCCCTLGEGWGFSCSQCPRPGTKAFNELCPKGYGFVDHVDVNECLAFPDVCSNGRCKNSMGSFSCRCNQGYTLDEHNVRCVNIDECSIMHGVCGNGTCIDIPGSFTCDCDPGFETTPMMQVCMDVNECQRDASLCRGGRCINTPGSYHCECPMGLEVSEDGTSCKDIDECSLTSGVCSNGICENMMGAYQCICDEGYEQAGSGTNCVDIDECATNNGGCDDICMNTPGSFSCACSSGHMLLLDGKRCKDIDECAEVRNPCNGGKCVNTAGSYSCVCSGGLMMGPDASTCLDLDECSINKDICKNGKCENTIGSFKCLCDDGYSLKGETEEGCSDDDECSMDLYHCDPMAECKNTNGSYDCICRDGFNGDGFDCTDNNECQTQNGGCDTHAKCINTFGSFQCLCDEGFTGDGFKCSDIDECSDDPTLCENGVCLNDQGSFSCECQMGYMHPDPSDTQRCIDIDECTLFDNVCINGICENLHGIFKCVCDRGYTLDKTGGNCTDIDECEDPQSCKYGTCINTDGSYVCQCDRGMELLPLGTGCVDKRAGICYSQYNVTYNGLSICGESMGEDVSRSSCCCSIGAAWGPTCEPCPVTGSEDFLKICPGGIGFQPNPVTAILEDINECNQMTSLCKNGRCSNTFGSYMCTCDSGYTLDDKMMNCVDVDECVSKPRACGQGECVNVDGGYECICPVGFVLSPDGQDCIDTRKEQCYLSPGCKQPMSRLQTKVVCCCSMGNSWGPLCEECPPKGSVAYQDMCGMGSPGMIVDPVTGMTQEIDECSLMPGMCQHGTCMNTIGSFRCECEPGYVYDETSHQCIDRNECAAAGPDGLGVCLGNARCVNSPGSFECVCPEGYRLDASGRDCLDVDECTELSPNACRFGTCTNVAGGFHCICNEGFVSTANRDGCVDRDECAANPSICGNGTCINTFGSHRCICNPGFRIGPKGDCENVDECAETPGLCRNGRCVDRKGSFQCECADGYQRSSDGRSCQDVDECARQDICPPPGVCINMQGSFLCRCPQGYRTDQSGQFCQDVNECEVAAETSSGFCSSGSCVNLEGGVECKCPAGWILTPDKKDCQDVRKGPCFQSYNQNRCMNPRPLNSTKAQCCCSLGAAWSDSCEPCPSENSNSFELLCPSGIGRGSHGEDLDECTLLPDPCKGGTCVNSDGGHRCECPPGHETDAGGQFCVDRDECSETPKLCGNGTCTNIDGGFECSCAEGFAPGPHGTCEDVDECVEFGHLCAFRCRNLPGSYRCVCPYGYEPAADGRHCRDVDECAAGTDRCRYECKNLVGGFACVCPEGYRRTGAADECEDVDECAEDATRCGPGGSCQNLPGRFTCQCKPGYELSSDGASCLDRRTGRCHDKVVAGRCVGSSASAGNKGTTKADCCCTMGAGWEPNDGSGCEICPKRGTTDFDRLCSESGFGPQGLDIDECLALPDLCANGQCVNTLGSYRCICDRGFKPDPALANTQCLDVDECRARPGPCEHECSNTYGSFVCSCPPGYVLDSDGRSCRDKDECALGEHRCQFECLNTLGSHECLCPPGFTQLGDRCLDVDECVEQQGLCPSPGTCKNTHGSFKCVCPRGYRLDESGMFCVDKDECEDEDKCSGSECRNLFGSYKCGCPDGFVLHALYEECVDANECLVDPSMDPCGNARCQNTYGSFSCLCPAGYSYDRRRRICIQNAAGCGRAPCAFGCHPVGSSGFSCNCPRGYKAVGSGGHCLVVNDLDRFLVDDDSRQFADYEGKEVNKNVVSTEGCFACDLTKPQPSSPINVTVPPRNRRHHRNSPSQRRVSRQVAEKSSLVDMTRIIYPVNELIPAENRTTVLEDNDDDLTKLSISLTADHTRMKRPILFLQPALTQDLVQDTKKVYMIRGKDRHLFGLKRSRDGVWALYYNKRVNLDENQHQVAHHIRILGKPHGYLIPLKKELHIKIKILVSQE